MAVSVPHLCRICRNREKSGGIGNDRVFSPIESILLTEGRLGLARALSLRIVGIEQAAHLARNAGRR